MGSEGVAAGDLMQFAFRCLIGVGERKLASCPSAGCDLLTGEQSNVGLCSTMVLPRVVFLMFLSGSNPQLPSR